MEWHQISPRECAGILKTDLQHGLSPQEAKKRLSQYGKNTLTQGKKAGILKKFFSQFADFMVLILLAAAAVSFATAVLGGGDYTDPIMILIIVLLNATIGTIQECRAENAIEALKKLSSPTAVVIRSGKAMTIPSAEAVPGDLIRIRAGDQICADARLVDDTALTVEEAALTGESLPTEKSHDAVLAGDTPLADRSNMVYAGTIAASGHALAVVTATGMNTNVGKIASLINEEESPLTPLQKSLARTGRFLGIAALAVCALIFVLGLCQRVPPLEMFLIAISLAVAAIPEGLPAVVTIVLALGVRKMALHRAIVRHLPAVETLGSTTVICSDKTGTLTQNRMTLKTLASADRLVSLHSPEGNRLLTLAVLCSNSSVSKTASGFQAEGNPTENALVLAAANLGLLREQLEHSCRRIQEIPFDSRRKRMTTIHALATGGYRIIVKGAPDLLLSCCTHLSRGQGSVPMDPSSRKKLLALNDRMANEAMRVIGIAYKDTASRPAEHSQAESGLIFCGLFGLTDPPRPQARAAVLQCKKAGIHPVMITGDHIITAKAVAGELGIYSKGNKALTGAELDKLSQEDLQRQIRSITVFARVSPAHKVRIVKAFRFAGDVVAMTGDGVNDAPALKCADIGCAMGISGTDAARSAADMILTDDNFSTVVEAVEEGRTIFANIKRVIHFLLSCNIGEILTVFCAFLLRLPTPLLAIQLLWVNLVTDSMPALALGVEPPDDRIMECPPVSSQKGLFTMPFVRRIVLEGCLIGALSFLAFTIGRLFFDGGGEPMAGRTMTFAVLSLSQLVHAFNLKSSHSLKRGGLFNNPKLIAAFLIGCIMQIAVISVPMLCAVFKTVPLTPLQWGIVWLLSLVPLVLA